MTWEIALGIFALVAFVISVGKLVSNNTQALTSLKVTCEAINEKNKEQDSDIKELQTEVGNHETRITVLEKK